MSKKLRGFAAGHGVQKQDLPKQVSSDELRKRIAEQQETLKSLEAAETEIFDDLMTSPDDPGKQEAMRSAAMAVTDAKEHLVRLRSSLNRAAAREAEALAETQRKLRQENLAALAAQRRIMGRQALELSVRFERFLDEWNRLLASAERVRALLLPQHQVRGGAHTGLMPLKLREAVQVEQYRLGGVGTSSQVTHDGNIRSLAAPGCATPIGLSLIAKADPASAPSLEQYVENLFASLLNEPLRPAAPIPTRTSPSAPNMPPAPPSLTPAEFFSDAAVSADPDGYARELARMKGAPKPDPAPEPEPATEPAPIEDTEEFKAALEDLRWRTDAQLKHRSVLGDA